MKKWTPEEDKFLRDNYVKYEYPILAKKLGRSLASIENRIYTKGLRLPPEVAKERMDNSRFYKGQISWNKGKKGAHYSPATEFTKGHLPANTLYDGAITTRHVKGRPYKFIRISMGKWVELHRYLWKQHFGDIPKGYVVRFKNGNTLDCRIENLELKTKKEHVIINSGNHNSDAYIAAQISRKDKELRNIIKLHPEIIEIQRLKNDLKKGIKNVTSKKAG